MDFRGYINYHLPLVTIGLLSYNNSSYVIETLDSIYRQSYHNIELIIVDDFSTDNSVQLIKNWIAHHDLKCKIFINDINYGIPRGCNIIVKESIGKYISIFGSDDIMCDNRIEELVNEIEKVDKSYAICYSNYELIDESGLPIETSEKYNFKEGSVFEDYFHGIFFIPAPTVLLRKEVFTAVGLYDERLLAEDYGMWMKILPLYKIKFCRYIGVKYRSRGKKRYNTEQLKQRIECFHRDRIYIYVSCVDFLKNKPEFNHVKSRINQKINFHLRRLQSAKSKYFWKMFFYLLRHFRGKINFRPLLVLSLKQLLFRVEKDYFWEFEE